MVASWFVLVTLKHEWVKSIGSGGADKGWAGIGLIESNRTEGQLGAAAAPGSFSSAAKKHRPP